MYAVVEAGGRQYQLSSGRFVDVDMVAGEAQSDFVFERVLMIVDGDKSTVGKPLIDGAKVTGKIISHGKGKKMVVYHYRAKKGTRKRQGHRQGFTRIYINAIQLNEKVLSEAKDAGKPAPRHQAEPKAAKPAVSKGKSADKDEKPAKQAGAAKSAQGAKAEKSKKGGSSKPAAKKKEQ